MLSTIDVVPFCIENFPLQLDNLLSTGGTNDIVALMITLFKSQHDQFLMVVAAKLRGCIRASHSTVTSLYLTSERKELLKREI